jgi:hypothetical protein
MRIYATLQALQHNVWLQCFVPWAMRRAWGGWTPGPGQCTAPTPASVCLLLLLPRLLPPMRRPRGVAVTRRGKGWRWGAANRRKRPAWLRAEEGRRCRIWARRCEEVAGAGRGQWASAAGRGKGSRRRRRVASMKIDLRRKNSRSRLWPPPPLRSLSPFYAGCGPADFLLHFFP